MGEGDTSGAEEDTNFSLIDVWELYVTELGEILTNIIEFGGIGRGKVDIRGGKSVLYVKFFVIVGVRCNFKWCGRDWKGTRQAQKLYI